jgi:hypothetical protein
MSTQSFASTLSPVRVTRRTAAIVAVALVAIAIAVVLLTATAGTTVSSKAQPTFGPSLTAGVPAGYVRDPATHAFVKIGGAGVSSPLQSASAPPASDAFGGHR